MWLRRSSVTWQDLTPLSGVDHDSAGLPLNFGGRNPRETRKETLLPFDEAFNRYIHFAGRTAKLDAQRERAKETLAKVLSLANQRRKRVFPDCAPRCHGTIGPWQGRGREIRTGPQHDDCSRSPVFLRCFALLGLFLVFF